MKVSANLRSCKLSFQTQSITASTTISRSRVSSRSFYTSNLKGHSFDATTIHTNQFAIHHTFLTGSNYTKQTLIFSRHYADPKDKKKESKEKESKEKAAAPAESKDTKKEVKKGTF